VSRRPHEQAASPFPVNEHAKHKTERRCPPPAALLYLADGEAHRIDEMAMHFDVAARRVRMIVYSLTENGLAEVAHENSKDEAVKLTPAGSALIVEISEMAAPR
jgi:predicted transcriptional regulator